MPSSDAWQTWAAPAPGQTMTNGPWQGIGVADGGGLEELQTDVMRFMAILAFCLVAVFALVQSMPMHPPPLRLATDPALPAPIPVVEAPPVAVDAEPKTPPPVAVEAPPIEPTPVPPREPVRREPPAVVPEPVAPVARQPVPSVVPPPVSEPVPAEPPVTDSAPRSTQPTPVAEPAAPPAPRVGFSLRFATDEALLDLVRAGSVGLYALHDDRAWRLQPRGNGLLFAPTGKPASLRMMSAGTIPDAVLDALSLSVSAGVSESQIGVTLPPATRAGLDAILRRHSGGDIVIEASGGVRLESGS